MPCASWAPDSRRLAFDDGGAFAIASLDGETTTLPGLAPNGVGKSCMVARRLGHRRRDRVWILLLPVNGSPPEVLSPPLGDGGSQTVAWSPTGSHLAVSWTTFDPSGSGYDGTNVAGRSISIFDLDGNVEHVIAVPVDGRPYVPHPLPVWSPDGRRLAWIQRPDQIEVVVAAADGSTEAVLSELLAVSGHPVEPERVAWSPDGLRLLITAFDGEAAWVLLDAVADGSEMPTILVDDVGNIDESGFPDVSWQGVHP